jgi:hypothetical protein
VGGRGESKISRRRRGRRRRRRRREEKFKERGLKTRKSENEK